MRKKQLLCKIDGETGNQITIGNTLKGSQGMKRHWMREPQESFTKMSALLSLFKLSKVKFCDLSQM